MVSDATCGEQSAAGNTTIRYKHELQQPSTYAVGYTTIICKHDLIYAYVFVLLLLLIWFLCKMETGLRLRAHFLTNLSFNNTNVQMH